MAKLGEVCIQITDGSHNPPSGVEQSEYLMLSSKNIDDDFITLDSPRFLSHSDYIAENKRTTVNEGDLLMTIVGTIGRVAIVPKELNGICLQRSVAVIKLNKEIINNRYLMYQLQNMQSFLEKEARGVAQKGIYLKQVSQLDIKLPELEQQKQIVKVLDKVSKLIFLRKQQLSKLDELVKAQFVEMFGDPYMNNKHYPLRKGESFFKLSNGKTVPEDKRLSNGVPAYGGNGISWYTNESLFNHDTIVVGRVGFQSGNVHIAKGPLWITDNAMYMSSCDFSQYNLIFLINLMEHIDFTKFQDAGDLKKITQKPFMQYEYICPPLPLQNQFAAFVERVDQQKQTVQQSLEKLELMKKALMQEYFG